MIKKILWLSLLGAGILGMPLFSSSARGAKEFGQRLSLHFDPRNIPPRRNWEAAVLFVVQRLSAAGEA